MEQQQLKDRTGFHDLINILKHKWIRTVYQPIVSLRKGEVIGYEALSRGPKDSPLESPLQLFASAEKFNRLWELELLCRTKALENAKDLPKGKLLFINVNPEIINDRKFKKGTTQEYISKYGMNPTEIIFEITEKTAVSDYKCFRNTINNYVSQGYKIAVDDTGSGYSGLRMLAETHPQYIKIDMELVRDIDKDIIKQELMKTFHAFAQITNMKLIAEGIETIDELNTLIDIGVHYGQGYLLQKPKEQFFHIEKGLFEHILERNRQHSTHIKASPSGIKIGEISRFDKPIHINSCIKEAVSIFNNQFQLQGLVVADEDIPLGLIMKSNLTLYLERIPKNKDLTKEFIHKTMIKNPLIVDYNESLKETSKMALARREENIYDYIIVTKEEKYYGVVPVGTLLGTMSEIN